MEIHVARYISNTDTTLSRIYVDGEFVCFGLEDGYRAEKVPGETRIPAGRYRVAPRYEGKHHIAFSKLFADIHKGALEIVDVPNFQYIMIHIGNTKEDTEGCLLVGMETIVGESGRKLAIGKSRVAYQKFYTRIIDAVLAGNAWITFVDNDLPT